MTESDFSNQLALVAQYLAADSAAARDLLQAAKDAYAAASEASRAARGCVRGPSDADLSERSPEWLASLSWLLAELRLATSHVAEPPTTAWGAAPREWASLIASGPAVSSRDWSTNFTRSAVRLRERQAKATSTAPPPWSKWLVETGDDGVWPPEIESRPVGESADGADLRYGILRRGAMLKMPLALELSSRADLARFLRAPIPHSLVGEARKHPGFRLAVRAIETPSWSRVRAGHDIGAETSLRLRVARAVSGASAGVYLSVARRTRVLLGQQAQVPVGFRALWRDLMVLCWFPDMGVPDWETIPLGEVLALLDRARALKSPVAASDLAALAEERLASSAASPELADAVQALGRRHPELQQWAHRIGARGAGKKSDFVQLLRSVEGVEEKASALMAVARERSPSELCGEVFRESIRAVPGSKALPAVVVAARSVVCAALSTERNALAETGAQLRATARQVEEAAREGAELMIWFPVELSNQACATASELRRCAADVEAAALGRQAPSWLDKPDRALPAAVPVDEDLLHLAERVSVGDASGREALRHLLLSGLRCKYERSPGELRSMVMGSQALPPEFLSCLWELALRLPAGDLLVGHVGRLRDFGWAIDTWGSLVLVYGGDLPDETPDCERLADVTIEWLLSMIGRHEHLLTGGVPEHVTEVQRFRDKRLSELAEAAGRAGVLESAKMTAWASQLGTGVFGGAATRD